MHASMLRMVAGGAMATYSTAYIAKQIFDVAPFIARHPNKNKISTLAGAAISIVVFTVVAPLSSYMVAGGMAGLIAFVVMSMRQTAARRAPLPPPAARPPAAPAAPLPPRPIQRGEMASLRDRLRNNLDRKDVGYFISLAIRKEKAVFIRQLCRYLFSLPQFQEWNPQSGLAVDLQEKILATILRYGKGNLFEQIFSPDMAEQEAIMDAIPSFYADVAVLCARYVGDALDGEGRFRVYGVTDGSLIHKLKESGDERLVRLARREESQPDDEGMRAYLTRAIQNTPSFQRIDFSPLIAELRFEGVDLVPEVLE